MNDHRHAAFEAFLVEDVILTLANLRASLAWFGEDDDRAAAAGGAGTDGGTDGGRTDGGRTDGAMWRRAGLARIDRQIGMLEDRARSVCRTLWRIEPDDAVCGAPTVAGRDRPAAVPGRDPGAAADRPADGAPAASAGVAAGVAADWTAPAQALPVPPAIAEAIRDALDNIGRGGAARGDLLSDIPAGARLSPEPAVTEDGTMQGPEGDGSGLPAGGADVPALQGPADTGTEATTGDLAAGDLAAGDLAAGDAQDGPAPVFRSRRAG